MNDEDIVQKIKEVSYQNLIDTNYRILTLLGIATGLIIDYQKLGAYHDNNHKCEWFFKAIEDVVYKNKPLSFFEGLHK